MASAMDILSNWTNPSPDAHWQTYSKELYPKNTDILENFWIQNVCAG